jgi:hypothetical protein
MAAGPRDQYFQPNQSYHQPDNYHNSRSLSLQARFDGPTTETPGTLKHSSLHGRPGLSFNPPSPQFHAKRRQNGFPDRPDVKRTMPSSLAYSGRNRNENAPSLNTNGTPGTDNKSLMDEGRPKNEDIFLNIARDPDHRGSGHRDSIGRSDFRRVSLHYRALRPIAFLIALAFHRDSTPR